MEDASGMSAEIGGRLGVRVCRLRANHRSPVITNLFLFYRNISTIDKSHDHH